MVKYKAMALKTINDDEEYGIDFIKNHIYAINTDEEVRDKLITENIKPMERYGGEINLADYGF